jgi:hypothetical protein
MSNFNDFRFEGLGWEEINRNKLQVTNRVSENEERVVVRFADSHIFRTRYGFGVRLDRTHVVFVKDWAVSFAEFNGSFEVVLSKQYFSVKEFGEDDEFASDPSACTWDAMVAAAKEQAETSCIWFPNMQIYL